MKKNITINLFGSLYSIDEDAFELLEKYLDNMKRYFSKRDGGDEIADDIEHRVAELFEEMKESGVQAIDIEKVQAIIKRIGNPEEMDDDASENIINEEPRQDTAGQDNTKKLFNGRKLYRNSENQVLGGVLSGLCTYFGANDPLPWRIIFIVLTLGTQIAPLFIIYLILWAVIPMAVTAEDRLRMKGRPINVDNLNEEIMRSAAADGKSKNNGIFATLMTIIGFCLKVFMGLFVFSIFLAVLITACSLALGYITPFSLTGFHNEQTEFVHQFIENNPQILTYTWISVIAAILFLGVLLYSIIHSIVRKNTSERMPRTTRISIILTSVVSLVVSIGFAVVTYAYANKAVRAYDHKKNTINGVYLADNQHERLAEKGWNIVTYENASERIYSKVQSFIDDDDIDLVLSFRRKDTARPMKINLKRTEDFTAGNYHIEAIVSAKCNGAYVYAENDSAVYASVMMPVDDTNNMGNMRNMSEEELRNTAFFDYPVSDEIWQEDDFRETISYWSYVRSASFHHRGGPINYGVTNLGSAVGLKDCSNPAWNFNLRNIKIVADEKK